MCVPNSVPDTASSLSFGVFRIPILSRRPFYARNKLDAGYHGAYHGKQASSHAIVGMMEVIETDFKNSIKGIKEAEAKANAEHVKFVRTTKSDIASKDTQMSIDTDEMMAAKTNIGESMDDLQTHTDLLDGALKQLADLKPTCMDSDMNHQERTEKRDEEIAALKQALCHLDPENVEVDC